MKLLAYILLGLFISIALALIAQDNPGYVLLAREPWSVEMPLTLFVILQVALMTAVYFLVRLLGQLVSTPRTVARWRRMRRLRRARETQLLGMRHLADGNWLKAEKQLIASLRYTDAPTLTYIAAAWAAQAQGHTDKRDDYLAQAHKAGREDSYTTAMAQAQMQLQARQFEQALATVTELRQKEPRNTPLLRLLGQIYRELREWDKLADLLPELRHRGALPEAELDALELKTHLELLRVSLPTGSGALLDQVWQAVPSRLRQQADIVAQYARNLMLQGQADRAETLVRGALEHDWNDALVTVYGEIRTTRPEAQLETAEGWLASEGESAALMLALGRLAAANNQPGKARDYLERCIALHGPAAAFGELGAVFAKLGDTAKALELYRRALDQDRDNAGTTGNGSRGRRRTTAAGTPFYGH